nr:MAG TPA: hypothetical protein [Bacteriophage sp.]
MGANSFPFSSRLACSNIYCSSSSTDANSFCSSSNILLLSVPKYVS